MKTRTTRAVTGLMAAALIAGGSLAAAPAAQAAVGTTSLASVLTAKSSFDTDGTNYDIVTAGVLAVLSAKPSSPVKVLADGTVALTAFIPNDKAFMNLVTALAGTAPTSEQAAFNTLAGFGIDTVEQVLLFHVVPGATILSPDALKANGASLPTALTGKNINVSVKDTTITLGDYDPVAPDPKVILSQVDINKGNAQVAHGIDAVLLPSAFLKAPLGTKSLAAVLTAKSSFDTDGTNYDIVTAAVKAVLGAKPNSPVKVLADGTVALTAFIPNDMAFMNLVTALTGKAPASEEAAFTAVAGLGIDTVEQVLEYHVVPGGPILSPDALKANGASLSTALSGKSINVTVKDTTITLGDYDPIAGDPKVILSQVDINKGNAQVAHGIDAVLLPIAVLKPAPAAPGTKSLAAVLTAKKSFDKNDANYDIVTAAVLAVLKAKPNSPVKVLADGSVALTAFIPNDGAFKRLVKALTGKMQNNEHHVFKAVASLGIPTVERILLFHVVPGKAIMSEDALKANGASLATAFSGKSIKVKVNGMTITLGDYNRKLADPKVLLSQIDINKGNMQVAHGIDAVLLPTA